MLGGTLHAVDAPCRSPAPACFLQALAAAKISSCPDATKKCIVKRTCCGVTAVLINQSAGFAFGAKHLLQHDAALIPKDAEDTVQMHPVLFNKQTEHPRIDYGNLRDSDLPSCMCTMLSDEAALQHTSHVCQNAPTAGTAVVDQTGSDRKG